MFISTEIADKYQEFFNFFSQEHNLILTIEQMQEILSEAQKLESKLSQHDVIKNEVSVCDNPHCQDGIVEVIYGERMRCSICDNK